MIVTLKKLSSFIIFFLISMIVTAQDVPCNREYVSLYKTQIPKEICVPMDYRICNINNTVDFNQDGLNDFVFFARKRKISVGDTTFVYFYQNNLDSTYTLIRRYDNIYPVYFNPNLEVQTFNDIKLKELYKCYGIPNPLNQLKIEGDIVEMTINLDEQFYEGFIYTYKFDKVCNDWLLIEKKFLYYGKSALINIDNEQFLSSFSYCD